MVKRYFYSILVLMQVSCFQLHNKPYFFIDDEISLEGKPRSDGYYYKVEKDNKSGTKYYYSIIFFEDGYFKRNIFINDGQDRLHGIEYAEHCRNFIKDSTAEPVGLQKTDCFLANYDSFNIVKTNFISHNVKAYQWGRYSMNGNLINVRYFVLDRNSDLYLDELSGKVYGDSILIDRNYFFKTKEEKKLYDTYYFRKADSIDVKTPDVIKKLGKNKR